MHSITINSDRFSIPSKWDEVTREQLLSICRISLIELPHLEFKSLALIALLGLKVNKKPEAKIKGLTCYLLYSGRKRYILSAEHVRFLSKALDWMLKKEEQEDGSFKYALCAKIIRNLLPDVLVNKLKFYGPADALTNLIYQEYIHAETYLDRFIRSKDTIWTDKLIAVLYRQAPADLDKSAPDYSGDPRAPLNDFHIDENAVILSALPADVKQAIMLFYYSCREYLVFKFPNVFSPGSSSTKNNNVFESHLKIINAMSCNDVTKNDAIRKSYLYEVLTAQEQMRIEQIKFEDNLNKKK